MMSLASVLQSWSFEEVPPISMYSDIFRLGEGRIQKRNEPSGQYKTNPIIFGTDNGIPRKRIMFEDQFEELLAEFQTYEFAILNGITYWGRDNISANQSKMYAMAFDLDGVTEITLNTFLSMALDTQSIPAPNYLVLSGHGVHPYYVFEEPISLYPNIKTQLKELKYELTDVIWNERTSTEKRQYQSINQGYRIAGGKTKLPGVITHAYLINSHPITLDELNEYVPESKRIDTSRIYKESSMSLEEARKRFPEWYERRIIQNLPPMGWKCDEKLYAWWKKKMFESASYGHRYYCVMALAIFGVKCRIPEERVREDASSFAQLLNRLNPSEPFLESDIESAMDCYDERYITFPRASIEKLTGISIPPRKRNGQDRATHLQADYWEIDGEPMPNPCKENREKALQKAREEGRITGRPKNSGSKRELVEKYFRKNPSSSIRAAAKELNISRTTVQKWKPKTSGSKP